MACAVTPTKLWAQETDCYAADDVDENRNFISSSFQWENDIGNSDRWYTNGMKYSRTMNPECSKNSDTDSYIKKILRSDNQSILLSSWVGGMNMYTPQNIKIAEAQPNDRPWAGWAYLGHKWQQTDIIKKENPETYTVGDNTSIEILVGVLGKWAHQDEVQRMWHRLPFINATKPMGWDNQHSGKPGVSLGYTKQKSSNLNIVDANVRWGVMAGNVVNQGSVGGDIILTINKFDWSDSTYIPVAALGGGPKQINPVYMAQSNAYTQLPDDKRSSSSNREYELSLAKERSWKRHWQISFFADVEEKYIASSTFISGTNVSIKPLVMDKKFGLAIKIPYTHFTFRLSRLVRSPEFTFPTGGNAPWQRITQLSFEYDYGSVRNPYFITGSNR